MDRLETILSNLGLDEAKSAVFACLAGKKRASVEELFEDTSLSRKAILTALEELEREGAVEREGDYFVVEDVQRSMLALLPTRVEELKAEIYSYRPSVVKAECPVVESVRYEEPASSSCMAMSLDSALNSVDILSGSLGWLDDKSLGAARAAVQRGVVIRVITSEHRDLEPDARALRDAGVEVRSHEYAKNAELLIVDAVSVTFYINEPPKVTRPMYLRLAIRDKGVCKNILDYVFNPTWHEARVVEEYMI